MDIIVFADSHGHGRNIIKALEKHKGIEYVLHLGDYGSDVSFILEYDPELIVEAVQGNNDRIKEQPLEKMACIAGRRIFMTHGHTYNVGRGLKSLAAKGRKENADIILFGHTHVPYMETIDGILFLNPGSIFRQRLVPGPSYAVIELAGNEIKAEIIKI